MTECDRLSVLGHELRSPVAALRAIAETMQAVGSGMPDAERRQLLELAVSAGRDVERLLSDPELFSIELRDVNLEALVGSLRRDRVAVAAEPGLAVHADPVRLRQALGNLVDNGLRHAQHVTVRAGGNGEEAWVEVADDGPGVEPGVDVFAAGVSGAGSTGLGLFVARSIALAHGGRLELVSSPGEGAVFRLSLPRASAANG